MPRPPRPEVVFTDVIQLDVASAAVLLYPNRHDCVTALRCGLGSLGLMGVLQHVPTENRRDGAIRLRDVPPGLILPPPLREIHKALHFHVREDAGWTRAQLRLLLQTEFGLGYRRFIKMHVNPWLIEKGLVTETEVQTFSIIPGVRHQPTQIGKALQSALRAVKQSAEELPALIERDRTAAAARMLALGPGVLLASNLSAMYPIMAEVVQREGAAVDVGEVRAATAAQRAVWPDTLNPVTIRDPRMLLDGFDAAFACADFIENDGP
jgi:hypothetical protein